MVNLLVVLLKFFSVSFIDHLDLQSFETAFSTSAYLGELSGIFVDSNYQSSFGLPYGLIPTIDHLNLPSYYYMNISF